VTGDEKKACYKWAWAQPERRLPQSPQHIYLGSINQGVKAVWDATNNTVGFNHMVASAPDAAAGLPAGTKLKILCQAKPL
jgi:hypothetical protein